MRIGILGSGLLGGKLGTLFARAGHEVVFSYARSKEKLKRLARNAGADAQAGTPAEAARHAEALILAVHWSRLADVLQQVGDVSGKIILNCSLPMNADNTELAIAHTSSGLEELVKIVPNGSPPPSTPCRARSCSAFTKGGAEPGGRASCIVATIGAPSPWP